MRRRCACAGARDRHASVDTMYLAAPPTVGLMLGFAGYTPEQLRCAVDDLAREIVADGDRGDDIV
jgi:hypothetical protein